MGGVVKIEALFVKECHVGVADCKGEFVSKGTIAHNTMGYYPKSSSTPLVLHVGRGDDVHGVPDL